MRYFKYKNTDKTVNNALKEQYKTVSDEEKRMIRKEKRWRKFSTIVSLIIYFSCVAMGVILFLFIPSPSGWFVYTLYIIGQVIVFFILLIACAVLTVSLTAPLWKKIDSFPGYSVKKELFSKACEHLRNYYGLKEPYIVTKCFEATDKKFQNHDVCIFVAGDELRITVNLARGFLHGERDLGCYAFKRKEITVSKRQVDDHPATELKADNTVFVLGYRAKGFIEKTFINPKSE